MDGNKHKYEDEYGIYFTQVDTIDAALGHQAETPPQKHTKRTIPSIEDPDYPTYNIVNECEEYYLPILSQIGDTPSVPKKSGVAKRIWIRKCTKPCIVLICIAFVVVVAIGDPAAVLGLNGKGMTAFLRIV